MSNVNKIKNLSAGTSIKDLKGETDTVKLWEAYKEQAALWRALALFQIPATFCLVVFSLLLWVGRSTTLNVPAKPLPGIYLSKEVPDTEFIEYAKKHIGKYFIGDLPNNLGDPFIEHHGFMWFDHPSRDKIIRKTKLMSIIFSQKNFAPGHMYRNNLVKNIINYKNSFCVKF
jgi:hypothetical protein